MRARSAAAKKDPTAPCYEDAICSAIIENTKARHEYFRVFDIVLIETQVLSKKTQNMEGHLHMFFKMLNPACRIFSVRPAMRGLPRGQEDVKAASIAKAKAFYPEFEARGKCDDIADVICYSEEFLAALKL